MKYLILSLMLIGMNSEAKLAAAGFNTAVQPLAAGKVAAVNTNTTTINNSTGFVAAKTTALPTIGTKKQGFGTGIVSKSIPSDKNNPKTEDTCSGMGGVIVKHFEGTSHEYWTCDINSA